MSWIVRQIIADSVNIREAIHKDDDGIDSYTLDFDNEDYNRLLSIEQMYKKLVDGGKIAPISQKVIEEISRGQNLTDVGKKFKLSRPVTRSIFYSTCEQIAFALGGEFTDEGWVAYMIEKYHLTNEQVDRLLEATGLKEKVH